MGSHVHHLPFFPPSLLPLSIASRTCSSVNEPSFSPTSPPSSASASLTRSTMVDRIVVACSEVDRREVVSSSPIRGSEGNLRASRCESRAWEA